jgi:hypothetical protein
MSSSPRRIRRREIVPGDVDRVIDLLTSGFGTRKRCFWERAFARLSEHRTPPGYPRYGYLLECDGAPVGVTLMIYATLNFDGKPRIRCNMSSWYVDPAFRAYAGQLPSAVLNQKEVTFYNVTPERETWPALEAAGYKRYCRGRVLAVPALSAWQPRVRVRIAAGDIAADDDLSAFEARLLSDHQRYGCLSVTCVLRKRRHPFVFQIRRKAGLVRFAYLIYCRDLDDFVRFAGPLGRFLAWRGIFLILFDADGPATGLAGRYCDGYPKYFRGPDQPRLGDLGYSERAMFGV